jgi:hypothetical protein
MRTVDDSAERKPVLRHVIGALSGVPFALIYGILTRWFFGVNNNDLFIVMTLAFILFVPLALGALTVWVAPLPLLDRWPYAVFMPWLTSALTILTIALFKLEAVVCIVMALPLFLLLATLGGLIVRWIRQRRSSASASPFVGLLLLAPYLLVPLEMQIPVSASIRQVDTSIIVDADVATIWSHIIEVDPISADEARFSPFHWIGLPKPHKAIMTNPGAEAVRYGYFEDGLIFIEEIVAWQENEYLAFTIERDPAAEMAPILHEIDGPYFQVLDGFYQLEPLADGRVRLHLSSRHQLSTHFNAYAGIWTDAVMNDLQDDILAIVRDRSEAAAR